MGGMAGTNEPTDEPTNEPTDEPIDAELVEDGTALDKPLPQVAPGDYDAAGVPSFDYVRDRIENRMATSIGSGELAGATPEGKAVEDQFEAREKAGRDKLEEIRRQMRGEK
jgi:phage shock protein A